jgi:hypothetical protein
MRKLALAALALWLVVGALPGIANARGGFPAGARLHAFGPPAAKSKDQGKAPVVLERGTKVPYVYVGVAGRTLEYPLLNSPRCAIQSEAIRSCAPPASSSVDDR